MSYKVNMLDAGWLQHHGKTVRLHSGATSDWLVNGRELFDDPFVRQIVLDKWWYTVWMYGGRQGNHNLDMAEPRIYGIPTGGTRWAEAFAKNYPGAVLLNQYKDMRHQNQPTFLVDDVTTTGASFDEFPYDEPRLVVVRRLSKYPAPWVTSKWMDVFLPIDKHEEPFVDDKEVERTAKPRGSKGDGE